MSARDKYHHIIRDALIRDGWTITHDPYRIAIAMKRVEIDLGAEQAIAVPHTLHDVLLLESDFRYILRELQVCLIFYNVQTPMFRRRR